jgi:hypothetical protein
MRAIARSVGALSFAVLLTSLAGAANVAVQIDVKPGSCPNTLSVGSTDTLRVAILGSSTFDVTQINLSSLQLHIVDGFGTLGASLAGTAAIGAVAPIASFARFTTLEEVASEDILGNCTTAPARAKDLIVQFSIPAIVQALSLGGLPNGAIVPLGITGTLNTGDTFSSLDSSDYITIRVPLAPRVTSIIPSGATAVAPNDLVITAPASLTLTANLSVLGSPTFQWFSPGGALVGVGEVFFGAPTSRSTSVFFNTAGQYLIRLTASLPSGTAQRTVRVTVNLNPNGVYSPSLAILPLVASTTPDATTNPDEFLTFGLFTGNETDSPTADAYYQAIDPAGSKQFFGDWLAQNGINLSDPTTYNLAAYFNAIDLGFGRRMISSKDGTAWVVTNHRTVDDAANNVNPIAAVAMEYQPDATTGKTFTKFYIYDRQNLQVNPRTGLPDAPRVTKANLDGGGAKFLPGLCIMCHGGLNPANVAAGQPYPNAGGNVYAHFLPFDLNALQYSSNPQFTRAAQEDGFRQFNQGVLNIETQNLDWTGRPMGALIELVEGWYGQTYNLSGGTLSGTQNSAFVASSYASAPQTGSTVPAAFYSHFIARSCRNCHSTRPSFENLNLQLFQPSNANFTSGLDLPFVSASAAGAYYYSSLLPNPITIPPSYMNFIMPQARRTHLRFWLSTSADPLASPPAPPQPEILRRFICDFAALQCQ